MSVHSTRSAPRGAFGALPHDLSGTETRATYHSSAPVLGLVLVMLWYASCAWLRPLALPDEGRYVGVAWEMLRSGDWLVPRLDGMPYFHKPPLFYWITAFAMQCFGPGVLAARAASWLAAVGATVGVFVFVRRWVGNAQAWAACAVLATMPLFFGGAQYANLDMLVGACIALAVLQGADAALRSEAGESWQAALACSFVFAGAGVLAKGLIGVVLPVFVLAAWAMATSRWRLIARLAAWWPGWLLMLALAAPWFVAMQLRYPDFAHYFFVVQHVDRFTGSDFNNGQPWWFYPAVLLAGSLPWWPWLLRRTRRVSNTHGDVRVLMFAWLLVVLVFFSLPHSKLVGYVLPALAPLAVLIGDALSGRSLSGHPISGDQISGQPASSHHLALVRNATFALAASVCVVASIAAHYVQPKSLSDIGLALRSQRTSSQPVIFIGSYYFDVPFYAQLDSPTFVIDAWKGEDIARDSWRRELLDAQAFDSASTTARLLRTDELSSLLCGAAGAWVVGPWPAAAGSALSQLTPERRAGSTALWHVMSTAADARAALGCDAPARVDDRNDIRTEARITPRG